MHLLYVFQSLIFALYAHTIRTLQDTVLGDYHSPNLPYLIDGDVKMTESNAILRYIGAKAAAKGVPIMGTTPSEVAANEFMIDKAMEFRNKVCTHGYSTFAPSFGLGELGGTPKDCWDKASANYKDGKPVQFPGQVTEAKTLADSNAYYERFLSPGPYFAGAHVTVCDFHMYELLDQQRLIFGADIYDGYPKVQAFLAKFGALPKVKAVYDKIGNLPMNNEMSYTTQGLGI
jgi:glutathione S-transferase